MRPWAGLCALAIQCQGLGGVAPHASGSRCLRGPSAGRPRPLRRRAHGPASVGRILRPGGRSGLGLEYAGSFTLELVLTQGGMPTVGGQGFQGARFSQRGYGPPGHHGRTGSMASGAGPMPSPASAPGETGSAGGIGAQLRFAKGFGRAGPRRNSRAVPKPRPAG